MAGRDFFSFTAVRPIEEGEELCPSYIGAVASDLTEREAQLERLEVAYQIPRH